MITRFSGMGPRFALALKDPRESVICAESRVPPTFEPPRRSLIMPENQSVTWWIENLKGGDEDAAQSLWQRYFQRLAGFTPSYMSPEQATGKPVDHRSDLFSLGVVLYELVTGRVPFPGSTFAEIADRILRSQPEALARFNYDVPQDLERIIRKSLEKTRESRHQAPHRL